MQSEIRKAKGIITELKQDEIDEGEEFSDKERKMRGFSILYENEYEIYQKSKNKKTRLIKSENCGMIPRIPNLD